MYVQQQMLPLCAQLLLLWSRSTHFSRRRHAHVIRSGRIRIVVPAPMARWQHIEWRLIIKRLCYNTYLRYWAWLCLWGLMLGLGLYFWCFIAITSTVSVFIQWLSPIILCVKWLCFSQASVMPRVLNDTCCWYHLISYVISYIYVIIVQYA